jgi:glycosyltransferase involved in cell wall biosynthesis
MSYRIGFIIEQVLGHVTHGQNLQENVRLDPAIQASWGLPAWQTGGLGARLPVYRSNWTLQAGWQARRQVAQMARRAKLDGLFFHTQVTAVLAQDWLNRIPGIVSLDATPLQYDRLGAYYGHATGGAWLENWKWRLNRDCYKKARKLVTWSAWAKQGLVDEYEVPAEKVTVIPPGVNPAFWTRQEPRADQTGALKILFVGGNLERKGGRLLIDAFRLLRAGLGPGIELHLVTKDPLTPEAGISVYHQVQPNSPELRRLYHESDVFCLPSKGDCLPMVLSEAGAAGLPIISTCVAAIPEVVREGENGLLIPPDDLGALTTAFWRLIQDRDLRLRMGETSTRIIRQNYDAVQNTTRLLDLLKETIDRDRAARRTR